MDLPSVPALLRARRVTTPRRAPYSLHVRRLAGRRAYRLTSHADELDATFVPELGMLGWSLRHRGVELLALPQTLDAYARTGAATGIPLLHPWANRLGDRRYVAGGRVVELDPREQPLQFDEHGLPIHGAVLGRHPWSVRRAGARGTGAYLGAELDLGAWPELLAAFPFPHRVRVDVELRRGTLTVRTTLLATGVVAVPIAFGHHPYLRVPEADRGAWEIELPQRTALAVDDRGLPTGARAPSAPERGPLGRRAFDDLFAVGEEPVAFALAGGGRELRVRLDAGYPYAQLFSPAPEPFVCFEPMTAPVDALRSGDGLRFAEPGRPFTAVWSLSVA